MRCGRASKVAQVCGCSTQVVWPSGAPSPCERLEVAESAGSFSFSGPLAVTCGDGVLSSVRERSLRLGVAPLLASCTVVLPEVAVGVGAREGAATAARAFWPV